NGKTKEFMPPSFQKFDADFVVKYEPRKEAKKTAKKAEKGKEIKLKDYELDYLIHKDDGGVILTGEKYYITYKTSTSSSMYKPSFSTNKNLATGTQTIYHYDNIIVINISPEGTIEWAQKIPKRQLTTSMRRFCSYSVTRIKDKLYFIFNDNPKNLNISPTATGVRAVIWGRAIPVIVTMDSKGNQKREALSYGKELKKLWVVPTKAQLISDNEMILYARSIKKSMRLFKIIFK
ncbi:MAG: hypothetical protein D6707_09725, partial [Bacteroidetes bacterium]